MHLPPPAQIRIVVSDSCSATFGQKLMETASGLFPTAAIDRGVVHGPEKTLIDVQAITIGNDGQIFRYSLPLDQVKYHERAIFSEIQRQNLWPPIDAHRADK